MHTETVTKMMVLVDSLFALCMLRLVWGEQFVHSTEIVRFSEGPLSEFPLYFYGGSLRFGENIHEIDKTLFLSYH